MVILTDCRFVWEQSRDCRRRNGGKHTKWNGLCVFSCIFNRCIHQYTAIVDQYGHLFVRDIKFTQFLCMQCFGKSGHIQDSY